MSRRIITPVEDIDYDDLERILDISEILAMNENQIRPLLYKNSKCTSFQKRLLEIDLPGMVLEENQTLNEIVQNIRASRLRCETMSANLLTYEKSLSKEICLVDSAIDSLDEKRVLCIRSIQTFENEMPEHVFVKYRSSARDAKNEWVDMSTNGVLCAETSKILRVDPITHLPIVRIYDMQIPVSHFDYYLKYFLRCTRVDFDDLSKMLELNQTSNTYFNIAEIRRACVFEVEYSKNEHHKVYRYLIRTGNSEEVWVGLDEIYTLLDNRRRHPFSNDENFCTIHDHELTVTEKNIPILKYMYTIYTEYHGAAYTVAKIKQAFKKRKKKECFVDVDTSIEHAP